MNSAPGAHREHLDGVLKPLRRVHRAGRTGSSFQLRAEGVSRWVSGHARNSRRRGADYQEAVVEVGKTWDWSSYADHFTEDANYVEHALGNMEGRENIREWIVSTMNMFPGSEMPSYPVEWYSIDADKGWVIFKNINTMKDPGDGSVHGAPVITVLEYAGDDKWSYEEDAYNPMNFLRDDSGLHPALPRTGHDLR